MPISRPGFSLALFVLALSATLVGPSSALAQEEPERPPPPAAFEERLDADAELASIDAQSAWAAGLYVTAVLLHVGGAAAGVGFAIRGICIWGCTDRDREMQAWSAASFVVSGIGLLTLIPAIALDVDSGSRRRRHRRGARVSLSIGPGSVGLLGTF